MGSSYEIECMECDYNKFFKVGIGMLYSPDFLRESFISENFITGLIRTKKTNEYIKDLLIRKNGVITDYGHKIYTCGKCNEFYERFYLSIDYGDASYRVQYKCSKCKRKLEEVEHIEDVERGDREILLEKYCCPKCGKRSLIEGSSISLKWD